MVNDHLTDAVTRIRNGYSAGLAEIRLPKSNKVFQTLSVLSKNKYLGEVTRTDAEIVATLLYDRKQPVILGIKSVSKPGQRIYTPYKSIPKVWGGLGLSILSTSRGIMSDKQARKSKVGGEILVTVW